MLPILNRLFSGKISMVALSAGVAAYARGDKATGRRLLAIASSAAPSDIVLHERAAATASQAGDHRMALGLLTNLVRAQPESLELQLRAAVAEYNLGDGQGAAKRCEEAIARSGDRDPSALMWLLTRLRLPGPSSAEVLSAIHNWLRPRTYVEIGVAEGNSLLLVLPGTRAIGVDPAPAITRPLPPDTTVYAEKSDDFFASRDVRGLLGGLPVEMAFIDGMHLFEFALRDFMNLERYCTPGSTILFDDSLPFDRRSADRNRTTDFWTGDVWRVIPALKKYRPDLRIHTIAASPTGLCLVRGLDPASRVIAENYDAIVKEFRALDYSTPESDKTKFLNVFPNDWERIKEILR
ncbi:MAG TPA: class I SAM-dependent methyltransferase [Burkholderiales bacterium]|jgi:hypothetical protein|nr:class I SAM-dependent methyltransferase [Burkholderiales bacterium]